MSGSNGAFPVSSRELAPRSPRSASIESSDASAQGFDRDAWSVGWEERAAWDAALDSDLPETASDRSAASIMADALPCDFNPETLALSSPTILDTSASEFSHARNHGDGEDPRSSPSTRFELLFGDSSSLQVDWSRQLTHWSLCLRTADAQTFALLSRSTCDLNTALRAGFGCEVVVQVNRQ